MRSIHVRRATSPRAHLSDHAADERAVESSRQMSPILSRQALRQTPKFGESRATTSPDSLLSTLGAYTLGPAEVPDMPTPPLPTLEEILYFYLLFVSEGLLTVGQGYTVQGRTQPSS